MHLPRVVYLRLDVDPEVGGETSNISEGVSAPGVPGDPIYDWYVKEVPPPNNEDVISIGGTEDCCNYVQPENSDRWS